MGAAASQRDEHPARAHEGAVRAVHQEFLPASFDPLGSRPEDFDTRAPSLRLQLLQQPLFDRGPHLETAPGLEALRVGVDGLGCREICDRGERLVHL